MRRFRIPFKYQLLIPIAVILLAILLFPLVYSLVISFQDFQFTKIGQQKFIGLENYINLFKNKSYWTAMRNTIVFVIMAVGIEVMLGFFLAVLLHNKATKLRGFFRSTLLSPMFITPIAVGLIFRFLTNSQLGVIPTALNAVGINIDLFSTRSALFSIALIDVWQWTPFMLLLLLAGLESLPEEPFEAARVDGAEGWKLVRYITLPLMRPIILAAVVIRMLDAFKVYEYIYAITRGGPGEATETMQYFIYRTGFIYFRAGEAAAMSFTFIIVITIMVVILFRILRGEGTNRMNYTNRKRLASLVTFAVLLFALAIVVFPYFWTFLASIKNPAAINHPLDFTFTPTWANWRAVIEAGIWRQALNSMIVGLLVVLVSLLAGAPAAYSFSRFNVGGSIMRFLVLLAQMLPPAALIVPLFLLMYYTKLMGSIYSVVIAHLTVLLPLVTWFLIGFFDDVPRDLEDAALVDGCTPMQTFLKIVLPIVRPGLGAAGLFAFVLSWNDMFYALLLTSGTNRTLPVGVAGYWTFRGVEMGQMSAAILLAIVPMIILSFFVQKFMLRGLSGGAIKG